jgi:hypothetical protein
MPPRSHQKTRPVLKCFPTGAGQVKAWCPYCNKWHFHDQTPDITSRSRSHREAHCENGNSPFRDGGYCLRLFTKEEIRELSAWRRP